MAAERQQADHSKSLPLERWLDKQFLSAEESARAFALPENARATNAVDFIIGYAEAEYKQKKGALRMMANTVAQTPEMAVPLFSSLHTLPRNRPDLAPVCADIRSNLLGGNPESDEATFRDTGLIEAGRNTSKKGPPTARQMAALLEMMTCCTPEATLLARVEDPALRGEIATDLNLAAVSLLRGSMMAVDSGRQFADYANALMGAANRLRRPEIDRALCEIFTFRTPVFSRTDRQLIFEQSIGYSSDEDALQTSNFLALAKYRIGEGLDIHPAPMTRGEQLAGLKFEKEFNEIIRRQFAEMGPEKERQIVAFHQEMAHQSQISYQDLALNNPTIPFPQSVFNRVSPLWKYYAYLDRQYPLPGVRPAAIVYAPTNRLAQVIAVLPQSAETVENQASRMLEYLFTVPGGEVRIDDPLLVENALTYLSPDGPETVPVVQTVQETGGIRISQLGSVEAAGNAEYTFMSDLAPLLREHLPVEVQIWKGRYMLQAVLDGAGVIRGANGQELDIPEEQRARWTQSVAAELHDYRTKMKTEMRQMLRNGMEPDELERLSPFVPALLTPELYGASFEEARLKLDKVKERVADPKRGLREEGLTIVIMKGQLPEQTPIETIHYNKNGSEATLTIGKTKIKIGMNLVEKPPRIETVNSRPFEGSDNEKIWLESVVFSPFADFISPLPKPLDDSVLLPGTEGLPLTERVRKTLEIIHKQVGHLYRLPIVNGKPHHYSDEQFRLVLALPDPLAGVKELNLKTYNETHPDPEGRIWDYAIYHSPSYSRNKTPFPKVTTPHAFDSLNRIVELDRQARTSQDGNPVVQ